MLMTHTMDSARMQAGSDAALWPSRNYDTSLGRFTSMDTFEGEISEPLTLQRYVYAQADPVNIVDPSGHYGESLTSQIVVSGIQSGLTGLSIGSPFRAYQAVQDFREGVAVREIVREAAFGALTDFGIGFAFGAGFRTLKLLQASEKLIQQGIETVFSKIRFASPTLRAGTQIPTYFELATEAGPVFIKDAATKHFPDIIKPFIEKAIGRGVDPNNMAGFTRSASALILESLESAISKALRSPSLIPVGKPIVVEGWELIFNADVINPVLRTVTHAVPKAIGL
jgi:RHS repeat-associated protein